MARPEVQNIGAGDGPHVKILLAVYNGGQTLPEQLDSINKQDHSNWSILAGDDGSDDDSLDVMVSFREQGNPLQQCAGPCQGSTANFLSLIRLASTQSCVDNWLAFCDQDDVWLPDRLSRGIAALNALPEDRPVLYCSRTWICNAVLSERRLSAPRPHPTGFRNALVQNVAAGNTILLNAAAARLVKEAAREVQKIVVHDWWMYQLISGAGGQVVHDDRPTVLYRQHTANEIGANDTVYARLKRIHQLLRGDFRDWNAINIAALRCSSHRVTEENRAVLEAFAATRNAPLLQRLSGLWRLRLYRQARAATVALWIAALLGRI